MQVTTIHRKQVFLGPEQHRLNTGLVQGPEQHFGGDVLSSLLMLNSMPCHVEALLRPCRKQGTEMCGSRRCFKILHAPAWFLDGAGTGSAGARPRSVTPPYQ
jgi:hypothetical protein